MNAIMDGLNPYAEALTFILRNPGTSGANGLAKLVLSLYNDLCGYSFAECVGSLDNELTQLAVHLVRHYASHGETNELREVGKTLAVDLYPRLWEMGIAMRDARQATRSKWGAAERKAEADALDAAEAALFADPAKLIPANKAKKLLKQHDPLHGYYNVAGDWRDTDLIRDTVHTAIDLVGGAELSSNCPEGSRMLAVRLDNRIFYVSTDYDALEAYLDTVEQRNPISRTVSVPPRGSLGRS